MDSDNSDDNDQEFWALVEEEFMDDSDEEQQLQNSGSSSRRKRRTTIDRGREEGHNRLFNDYFSENPVYADVQFRRRFIMHRHKCTAAIRMLAYGSPADLVDEYV
ncbi:hypothetical protein KIW84_031553 [Lathyrus oleraceus]|uniref:Uncharacterized protein n=1 Tax=Pisum sativum TaxID=3888 RepID=A0A9D4XSP0_PEA|nr:hypothetical protein KIW84_031553 [Pisum sativum]